jgi:hypothetical protein
VTEPNDREKRFMDFVDDLEKISAKYGIIIQVTGHVWIHDKPLEAVTYTKDSTSGDIIPIQIFA